MPVPRLHLISGSQHCPVDRLPAVAAVAAAGGVEAVHIREPGLSDRELEDLAAHTRTALSGTGCRLLVNGNVDVALAVEADGVHLPERGLEPSEVRSRLGDGALIGMSVHSVAAAERAARGGVDYVIAGHIFETGSKPGQSGRGLEFLRNIARAVSIPVIAIGGISPERVPDVTECGAYGVAVLSGILAASDPGAAASRYASALQHGRG